MGGHEDIPAARVVGPRTSNEETLQHFAQSSLMGPLRRLLLGRAATPQWRAEGRSQLPSSQRTFFAAAVKGCMWGPKRTTMTRRSDASSHTAHVLRANAIPHAVLWTSIRCILSQAQKLGGTRGPRGWILDGFCADYGVVLSAPGSGGEENLKRERGTGLRDTRFPRRHPVV